MDSKDGAIFLLVGLPQLNNTLRLRAHEPLSIQKVEEKFSLWIENTNFEMDKNRDILINMPYLYEEGRDIGL